MPHPFKIGDKVLIANEFDTTKNPKLVPNWKGPGKIIYLNDTNAKIKFKNKIKVAKLKHFYENVEKSIEKEGDANQFNQNFNQPNEKALTDFNDIFNKAHSYWNNILSDIHQRILIRCQAQIICFCK